jgi:hypothetical protein
MPVVDPDGVIYIDSRCLTKGCGRVTHPGSQNRRNIEAILECNQQ